MSEDDAVFGVLLTHGAMADGLLDAVRRIAGDQEGLIALSNEGLGPEALKALLDEAAGTRRAIVFTDMAQGSCAMAAAITCKEAGRRAVVCGVNLPVLLDFVFNRTLPLDELVERLVDRGRQSIRVIP